MSIQAIVQAGRLAAEANMTDRCTVSEVTGRVTDDLTGQVTDTIVVRYVGRCRVQQRKDVASRTDAGEVSEIMLRLELQLPVVGSENVGRGNLVTITVSPGDSDLLGRVFRIRDLAHKSHATARRCALEEIT